MVNQIIENNMKKIFFGACLLTVTVATLSFTNTNGNTDSKATCPDTSSCVCCPCTPDCQPGDLNCVCPMDCTK